MANPFNLNVRLEDDDNHNLPLYLNEPIVEGDTAYGNVLVQLASFFFDTARISFLNLPFWTGFDLNLPLDEFGAVDLDFSNKTCPARFMDALVFFFYS